MRRKATTTSSSAPVRRAACSPTGCRRTRPAACCCWRRAATTAISGSSCRSATSAPSTTSASRGCSRPSPRKARRGARIVWPRGRVLGGSSSINGLIFIRGQHEDFDDWERAGAEGWGYRDVLPSLPQARNFRRPAEPVSRRAWAAAGVDAAQRSSRLPRLGGRRAAIGLAWSTPTSTARRPMASAPTSSASASAGAKAPPLRSCARRMARPNLTVITARACDAHHAGGHARRRRRMGARRQGGRRTRGARGDPFGWRPAVAPASPALRHRPGRAAAQARHRRCRRSAGRRREPAGPLPGAHDRSPESAQLARTTTCATRFRLAHMGWEWLVARPRPADRRRRPGRRRRVHAIRAATAAPTSSSTSCRCRSTSRATRCTATPASPPRSGSAIRSRAAASRSASGDPLAGAAHRAALSVG